MGRLAKLLARRSSLRGQIGFSSAKTEDSAGLVVMVTADSRSAGGLAARSIDAVIVESKALSKRGFSDLPSTVLRGVIGWKGDAAHAESPVADFACVKTDESAALLAEKMDLMLMAPIDSEPSLLRALDSMELEAFCLERSLESVNLPFNIIELAQVRRLALVTEKPVLVSLGSANPLPLLPVLIAAGVDGLLVPSDVPWLDELLSARASLPGRVVRRRARTRWPGELGRSDAGE